MRGAGEMPAAPAGFCPHVAGRRADRLWSTPMSDTPSPRDASSNGTGRSLGIHGYEGAAILLAVLIAHLFFLRNAPLPLAYDDYDYARAGRGIWESGLFSKFYGSEIRTYGYPLFLSLVHGTSDATGVPFKWIVFETQLLFYLLGAAVLRAALMERSETLGRVLFCAVTVNFYALLYATEVLAESLSLSALLLAAASWLRLQREPARLAPLFFGSAIAAAAVMIRPANIFLLVSWIIGCLVIFGPLLSQRRAATAALTRIVAIIILVSAIVAPQWINNVRNWQRHTPLVALDLQLTQQQLGVENIKYATALPPAPQPEVFYRNPLASGTTIDPAAPLQWYAEHPLRGVVTLALHIFNITDQDLLFTYARDLRPWFRLPHGVLNHAIVALGLLGFAVWWGETKQKGTRADFEAAGVLSVLALSNAAVYASTAVEMRFGLTLLSILFPCAAYALFRLHAAEVRWKLAASGAVATYAVGALLLSGWVRSQAPQIAPA